MSGAPLRYGLIGAGSAARTHVRDILGTPGVELVGIADPMPPTAWRIPEEQRAAARFTDAARLLRETRPELVSVCTPPRYHHELTLMAFRAGASVICEKPMAMSIGEALEMEAARSSAGRLGAVNFTYRNVLAFRYARELVARGDLGPITRVSACYLQSFMAAAGASWSWRHDARIAGFGVLGDLGVHMIDGVRFITGLEFQRVASLVRTLVPERPGPRGAAQKVTTDTQAMFLAELGGGAMAMFETTQLAPGYGDLFRIELSGERGSLCVDSEHPDEIRLHATLPSSHQAIWRTDLPARALPVDFAGREQPKTPRAIVEAIRGAAVTYPGFADGVAAQRVLDAIRRSTTSGAWAAVH